MKLTTSQVKKVSELANLPIHDVQLETYAEQLSKILDYIDALNEVETDKVVPTYNVTGLSNIFHPDEIKPSLSQDEATKNGVNVKNGYFVTKGVFEED